MTSTKVRRSFLEDRCLWSQNFREMITKELRGNGMGGMPKSEHAVCQIYSKKVYASKEKLAWNAVITAQLE